MNPALLLDPRGARKKGNLFLVSLFNLLPPFRLLPLEHEHPNF
jgi:hypothetical protein